MHVQVAAAKSAWIQACAFRVIRTARRFSRFGPHAAFDDAGKPVEAQELDARGNDDTLPKAAKTILKVVKSTSINMSTRVPRISTTVLHCWWQRYPHDSR